MRIYPKSIGDECRVLALAMRANIIMAGALVALFNRTPVHAGEPTAPLPPDLCEEPVHAWPGEAVAPVV